ncbi:MULTISPECIES: PaaI family thioesterase [unclassified Streptomyces]|uniref:PaaI family thioesterase n=1 Tax=unclassified Streptomyces TaxID=2593676 RepID=UPI0022B6BE47|nr:MULTISPECIES: PaaI family thioesterase [unclassified Streptomyces]MCZ7415182.1 PaaI family thioesterase [Streptomyces sp. WMMC897]MCZ7432127.1 PaaI family thioesterase [Streptomyces sp. WMMC1477]
MTDQATPVELPWLEEPLFRCFGCSPRNEIGLALRMFRLDDGRLGTDITFSDAYASYPGVVHGGIVSVLVDELMGDLIALDRGLLAFSATLRTKFLSPLRTGTPYRAVARIARESGGVVHAEADVLDTGGTVHVMANSAYQPIRSEQAEGHMGLSGADRDRLAHYFDHAIG